MTATRLDRRSFAALIPVLGVGGLVIAVAAVSSPLGAQVAAAATLVTLALFAAAEGLATLLRIERPLERMLFTMLVRGGGAMLAVLVAITGAGLQPKLVALIALPLYLSLIAGEAIGITQSSGAHESETVSVKKEAV